MYFYDLQKAADELIRNIMGVQPGETVAITADTASTMSVVNAVASSAHALGALPMVITIPTPRGVGKAADPDLPIEPLTAALLKADVWIELNKQWILYSTPFERVEAQHKSIRYINLVEYNEDMFVRTIGQVDTAALKPFMKAVAGKTRSAKTMRCANAAGTDVSFELDSTHLTSCDCGEANVPGIHMVPGQINVVPKFGSINGTIVFDGTISPTLGHMVNAPVKLTIKDSVIVDITGGSDADTLKHWLESFDDPGMFKLAHIAYGFNPGAKLTGNVVEDERVWGVTEWGIGYVSPYDAPPAGQDAKSHCDGICLNSSVWLDGVQIMDEGRMVDPELAALDPMK